jgi:soluble lytic murein transglycosylase
MDFPDQQTRAVLQRCQELIMLGLWSEAEAEIMFLLSFDNSHEAKQQLKIMLGEVYFYAGRSHEALKLVRPEFERLRSEGRFSRIPREIWRLNFPLGYWEEVQRFALQYDLDPFYVLAVIREESMFRTEAMSWAKAHGLMQIIPSTARAIAKSLKFENFSLDKIFEPDVNIQMGAYYLAQQKQKFFGNPYMALAAYNGGPGNVYRWYQQRKPDDVDEFIESIPFDETYHYVKKVMTSYWYYQLVYGASDPNQIVAEASYSSDQSTN